MVSFSLNEQNVAERPSPRALRKPDGRNISVTIIYSLITYSKYTVQTKSLREGAKFIGTYAGLDDRGVKLFTNADRKLHLPHMLKGIRV